MSNGWTQIVNDWKGKYGGKLHGANKEMHLKDLWKFNIFQSTCAWLQFNIINWKQAKENENSQTTTKSIDD